MVSFVYRVDWFDLLYSFVMGRVLNSLEKRFIDKETHVFSSITGFLQIQITAGRDNTCKFRHVKGGNVRMYLVLNYFTMAKIYHNPLDGSQYSYLVGKKAEIELHNESRKITEDEYIDVCKKNGNFDALEAYLYSLLYSFFLTFEEWKEKQNGR